MKIEEYELKQLPEPLLNWFKGHARTLPWRSEPTPYRVWVSEIMLQQTRVEAVKPYFERFMKELPDVAALADCPEEKLLKLWEGLGYYNRARNLQAGAQYVMETYGGEIPSEYEELLQLKGVGSYTAGAIASIAFGKPVPAVDGNVLRVISRVAADERDIMKQSVRKNMENCLKEIMPEGQAGAFNQALMELGATVCVPNGAPACEKCPWQKCCLAYQEGKIDRIPVKQKAAKRKIEEHTILVILDGEKIFLTRRPKKGLLAGMYEFPNRMGYLSEEESLSYVKSLHLQPLYIERLTDAKHIFSHVEWYMKGYLIRVAELEQAGEGILFAETSDFKERYPMPSAYAAYTDYLNIRLGKDRFDV